MRGELYGFAAGPDAARALDRRVRGALAGSLRQISGRIGPAIGFEPGVAAPVIAAVRARRVSPAVFGLYTELVEAGLAEDVATAAACARQLPAAAASVPAPVRRVTLTDDELGPGNAARYLRLINDEPDVTPPMQPVDAAARQRADVLIEAAFALLDAGAPALAAELRALVSQIVLVHGAVPAGDTEALVFDGASTFYLWGALFLNAARQSSRVGMAVALVHEAAHGLLFGMTLGAPLVENDTAERFASPLRHDKRPMDGLVHATYVLARMIDCLRRLVASGAMTAAERAWAEPALRRHEEDYAAGLATVLPAARFTPAGAAAFTAMRAAIAL